MYKYFSEKDAFGDFSKMNPALLTKLDAWRDYIGIPVLVTSGTQGVHTDGSEHYKGNAVDVIVPSWSKPLIDLYFSAERFGFNGIGIYRDWTYLGKPFGGLHLDVRDLASNNALREARWIGVKQAGLQKYLPFDFFHLRDCKLL